jgi:saccharopine dehydrogenase-like NADP-dependent oxidoreductase
MRVGALPQYPSNALKYNMTWSTEGLINEYCNPCEAIHGGELREMLPLEGLEEFALDGVAYEAFNTSGGLGTLCDSYAGKVRDLNYKTIRYPGHNAIVKLLLNDLGLSNRRDLLKDVLEASIPGTPQDVIVIFVTVSGLRDGRLTQESYAKNVYGKEINGKRWSAIQLTTAAGICTMVDLVRNGSLPGKGLVRQEQADLKLFLGNRFGQHYT